LVTGAPSDCVLRPPERPARFGRWRRRSLPPARPDSVCSNASFRTGSRTAVPTGARPPVPSGPLPPETASPSPCRLPGDSQLRGNLLFRLARCQPEDDLGPLHRSRRQRAAAGTTVKLLLLLRGRLDLCDAQHAFKTRAATGPLHLSKLSCHTVQRNLCQASALDLQRHHPAAKAALHNVRPTTIATGSQPVYSPMTSFRRPPLPQRRAAGSFPLAPAVARSG
jgi:hypothetical protein